LPRRNPSNAGSYRHFSRRSFLKLMGAIGGSAAVWQSMNALNLTAASSREEPPELDGEANGTSVIVLGAGPAGCATAYELQNRGYDVQVLDALDRVGGHVFTVRQGDEIHELGGEQQVCEYDEDQYWNAGAWRIPQVHHGSLHYCREFNIPLERHTNVNANAWVYLEDIDGPLNGERLRIHTLQADMRGHTAELLAKAVDQDQLDVDLTDEDRDLLIEYLISEGLLSSDDLSYGPNTRRGYLELPGAGDQAGEPSEPIDLVDLLPFGAAAKSTAGSYLASVASVFQQDSMMQVQGGMDRLFTEGFASALEDVITLRAAVREIRQDDDQVRIVYEDLDSGDEQEVTADYCISTIPLSALVQVSADFSPDMREAIQGVPYFTAGKAGLQFDRRFWEEDEQIYGGITFTNIPEIDTFAYPNFGFHGEKGVVQAYYNFGSVAVEVSNLSNEERMEMALEHTSKFHPQVRDTFENGMSVAWHRMPFLLGAWPSHNQRTREQYEPRLLEPDGRIYLSGEFLSHITGWMEGAFQAAWLQLEKLHERAVQEQND
jgi:monoamine oxidase